MKRAIFAFVVIVCFALNYTYATCEQVNQVRTLRIYGKGAAGDWDNPEFNAAFPSIKIEGSETLGVANAADLITVLLTEEAYDIYIINYANSNFSAVTEKGYALDLNCSPIIATSVSRMYDFLSHALVGDTSTYGIPIEITCQQWGISKQVFDLLKETIDIQIPRNYHELFDFFEWWVLDGQYEYPDICLMKNAVNIKKDIIEHITRQILDIAWSEQSANILLDPSIKDIYQRIESISFDDINAFVLDDGGNEMKCLFDITYDWADLEEYAEEYAFEPLVLELSEDVYLKVPIDIRIMFINPSTLLRTESIAYIEYFMKSQNSLYNILMFNLAHDPIENPHVAKRVNELKRILEDYSNKEDGIYEAEIDATKKRIEKYEKMKWLVTKEKIEEYQENGTHFFVREFNPVYMNDKDNTGGLNRSIDFFAVGKITHQQFIDDLYRLYSYAVLEER